MGHLLYLDPSSGSMLLQAIIAAFLAVGFFLKNIKNYVIHIFIRSHKELDVDAPNQSATQPKRN